MLGDDDLDDTQRANRQWLRYCEGEDPRLPRLGSRQGQWLAYCDAPMIRGTIADIARHCVGARYVDLIAPGETEQMRRDMARQWGCALVCRGILTLAGVNEPELRPPYRITRAMADVIQIGQRYGAWIVPSSPAECRAVPQGAMVVMGQGLKTHIATVTARSVHYTGAVDLVTVDGVRENGVPTVAVRGGRIEGTSLVSKRDGARRIRGWVDPARLVFDPELAWMLPA